jgi:hypothetical protein
MRKFKEAGLAWILSQALYGRSKTFRCTWLFFSGLLLYNDIVLLSIRNFSIAKAAPAL